MNKKYFIVLFAAIFTACIQSFAALPSKVKDAVKSVLKLTTYKADGSVIDERNCIIIDENGTAISTLSPFIGADKARITDSRGRQSEVTRIYGANELYNVIKFKVGESKSEPVLLAQAPAKKGDVVWIISYDNKDENPIESKIENVETFMDKYSYYILNTGTNTPKQQNCILVNNNGEVIGLTKPAKATTGIHAVDANFAISLTPSGFSLNDPVLKQIGIPPVLPQKQDQALLMLIMAEQKNDNKKILAIASDYIESFPKKVDGYATLARLKASMDDFKSVEKTMDEAIKQVENKDEAYSEYGKLIYDIVSLNDTTIHTPWTLETATELVEKAYCINPQPIYRHQLAQINFTKGKYKEAYDEFISLLKTPIRNPELFYEAAKCKKMQNAPQTEIIALLDSAINTTDSLRMNEAAPYFLERAEAYNANGDYREAVFDYTRYEVLSSTRQSAFFYYTRAMVEIKARLYQQALTDMNVAIVLEPQEPTYYAELASLQLRVNLIEDAIKTATRCVEIAQDYSDGYLILGLAQISKGNKTDGLTNLKQAEKLGNPQAKQLIEKYSEEAK